MVTDNKQKAAAKYNITLSTATSSIKKILFMCSTNREDPRTYAQSTVFHFGHLFNPFIK